jgi:hypothetical protein
MKPQRRKDREDRRKASVPRFIGENPPNQGYTGGQVRERSE